MNARRTTTKTIAGNILSVIVRDGADMATIAAAADMPVADLEARLAGDSFTARDLVRVGGFLRMSPEQIFHGAAA